jgi:hypothetical protein
MREMGIMRKLKINRMNFELAFELDSYETTAYLDTVIGDVLFVEEDANRRLEKLLTGEDNLESILATVQASADLSDTEREQMMDAARVEWDDDTRYRLIPKQNSREGYQDMQEYIWSLEVKRLRELLEVAIQGSGAFRRFKDVLNRYPEAQENWFRFRDEREKRRMVDWLESEGIEPEFE